mmetsp:Transcript_5588/g.11483  ORF Transcript_5588/g.11483 Transcript_5588/m.11483 type:complete len:81 (+) Transcript_5588:223-465(+)
MLPQESSSVTDWSPQWQFDLAPFVETLSVVCFSVYMFATVVHSKTLVTFICGCFQAPTGSLAATIGSGSWLATRFVWLVN